jgi:chaperonin cofactor prefoldin
MMLQTAASELKEYKKQIETYRAEIESMRHELEKVNSDNMSHILPRLQLTSETYNSAII